MIDLTRTVNSWVSLFFSLLLTNYLKILLYDKFGFDTKQFLLALGVTSLKSLWFLIFSIVLQKLYHSSTSKNLFWSPFLHFLLSSVFIPMYDFNQAPWLNLMILCTFFQYQYNSMHVLNFYVYNIFFFSCKLPKSFSFFSIFIILGKNGKRLWRSCNISDIELQLQEIILHYYLHCSFVWNLY